MINIMIVINTIIEDIIPNKVKNDIKFSFIFHSTPLDIFQRNEY